MCVPVCQYYGMSVSPSVCLSVCVFMLEVCKLSFLLRQTTIFSPYLPLASTLFLVSHLQFQILCHSFTFYS